MPRLKKLLTVSLTLTTYYLLLTTPARADSVIGQFDNPAPNFTNTQTLLADIIGGTGGPETGILPIAIIIGGILLLFMLIFGGFEILTNPTNPQAQEGGKQRITWAIIGFLILFASYWIAQLLQIMFNLQITGG